MEVNGKPWVIKEGPNADKWRAMGYELFPVEPAAQPQGEPVAGGLFNPSGNLVDIVPVCKVAEPGFPGFTIKPLYLHPAEQPAPVAVDSQSMNELRQIFDSNKGADGTLVISKTLAAKLLGNQ